MNAFLNTESYFSSSPVALQGRFGLPPTELLLESYSCALKQKNSILLQGRLHVFPHHIGFACDLISQTRSIVLNFSDIAAIKKAKTVIFVPNAIEIITCSEDRYIFASFLYRNEAFRMIHNLWAIARGIAAFQERHATISNDPNVQVF
jgi:hypothetical protein